jgi:type IV fimbrial biogenesis protein FimT
MRQAELPAQPGTRARGVTLIETTFVLVIVSGLIALAMPAFRDWLQAYGLASHAQYLAGHINRARSEAIKRGYRVNLCPSEGRRQCTDAGDWARGWILHVDENRNGRIDDEEPVLEIAERAPEGITVHANRPVEDYVSYTTLGHARMLNGALQMGTFTLCRNGQQALEIVLANSGRVRIVRTRDRCP